MKICSGFSLKSPHRDRGDSNENTNHTIFNKIKKIPLNYPKSTAIGFFLDLKNEFKTYGVPRATAVVKEPSVFELLKLYCGFSS